MALAETPDYTFCPQPVPPGQSLHRVAIVAQFPISDSLKPRSIDKRVQRKCLHSYVSVAMCSGPASAGHSRPRLAVAVHSRQEPASAGKNGTVPYSSVQFRTGLAKPVRRPTTREAGWRSGDVLPPSDWAALFRSEVGRCGSVFPVRLSKSEEVRWGVDLPEWTLQGAYVGRPAWQGGAPKCAWGPRSANHQGEPSTLSPRAPRCARRRLRKTPRMPDNVMESERVREIRFS